MEGRKEGGKGGRKEGGKESYGEKKNSSGTDSTRALVAEVLPENHVTSSLCYIFRLIT